MLEHGVQRMKQLDGDYDQRLLGRFALGRCSSSTWKLYWRTRCGDRPQGLVKFGGLERLEEKRGPIREGCLLRIQPS